MGMRELEQPDNGQGDGEHMFVATLEPGPLRGIYLVTDSRALTARNGKPYLALTLKDNSGQIGAKRWDAAEGDARVAQAGKFVEITGTVEMYKDSPQVVIDTLAEAAAESIKPENFEAPPDFDPAALKRELIGILRGLEDEQYRLVAEAYLNDEVLHGAL
jgi:3'-5' exoribonuclease